MSAPLPPGERPGCYPACGAGCDALRCACSECWDLRERLREEEVPCGAVAGTAPESGRVEMARRRAAGLPPTQTSVVLSE